MVKTGSIPQLFFNRDERNKIVEAIHAAEAQTSGEIRVFMESNTRKKPEERAKALFEKLGMTQTSLKNGVLIYLALKPKAFVILGDQAIHEKVGQNFWTEIRDIIQHSFTEGNYVEGLVKGIGSIGLQFKHYFPRRLDDLNEISDDIAEPGSE